MVTGYSSEKAAKKAYAEIELEPTNVKYDSTPVPFFVKISDLWWGRYEA